MSEQTPFAPFSPSITPETPSAEKTKTKKEIAAEKKAAKAAEKSEPKTERKPRATTVKTHAPKFDLQTTLAAAKLLNEDDFPLFEKLIIMLDEADKPTRERVMAALGKVFG